MGPGLPGQDNPLASLLQVRERRRVGQAPRILGLLAALLTILASWWLAAQGTLQALPLLVLLFLTLFGILPGLAWQREAGKLGSLRQGRCLEEMLSVGLTPEGISDTLSWHSFYQHRFALGLWFVATLPWLVQGSALTRELVLLALPVGAMLALSGFYLGQILQILADRPAQLLRGSLQLYGLSSFALAPAFYVFAYLHAASGLALILLGQILLLLGLRRRSIELWRQDLMPQAQSHSGQRPGWGSWLADFCSNPILVRELRASRRHSFWVWAILPPLVLGSLGLALPLLNDWLGQGLGVFALWLLWRVGNFTLLSERSRELLRREQRAGSWELLLQVGLAGPQFVKGWFYTTLVRHAGWIVAELIGLALLAHYHPQWLLPGFPDWAPLWVAWLWMLGLLADTTAFVVGLSEHGLASGATRERSLLPGLILTTLVGELGLGLMLGSGVLVLSPAALSLVWSQCIPSLGLLALMLYWLKTARAKLTQAMDPLSPAPAQALVWETLPQHTIQWLWCAWFLLSPTLAPWRELASPLQIGLVLLIGAGLWGWLAQPLAWALAPYRPWLSLQGGSRRALLGGSLLGMVCAIPVVLAGEWSRYYWMLTGQNLARITQTHLESDLPLAMIMGIGLVWAQQFWTSSQTRADHLPTREPGPNRLVLVGAATLALGLSGHLMLVGLFPTSLNPTEQAWWNQVEARSRQRNLQLDELMAARNWDEDFCQKVREQLRPGFSLEQFYDTGGCLAGRAELLSQYRDNLELGQWSLALQQALLSEWLDTYQILQVGAYHELDEEVWMDFVDALDSSDPDVETLTLLVQQLEASLGDDSLQKLVDEKFVSQAPEAASCCSKVSPWWPQALQVGWTRTYLRRQGLQMGPRPPLWVQAHAFSPKTTSQPQKRSRVWKTLLKHRAEMALGESEWGSVHVSPAGDIFMVTREGPDTVYWLSDQAALQSTLQSALLGQQKLPRERLYTVTAMDCSQERVPCGCQE